MIWFRNLKARQKLYTGFGVVVLVLLVVGGIAYTRVSTLSNKAVDIGTNYLPSVEIVGRLTRAAGAIDGAEYSAAVVSDPAIASSSRAEAAAGLAAAAKEIATYEPLVVDSTDRANLAAAKSALDAYTAFNTKLFGLIDGGQKDQAVAALEGEGRSVSSAMDKATAALDAYNTTLGDRAVADARSTSSSAKTVVIVFLVIGVILSALIATFVAATFSGPLRKAAAALARLAEGDLTVAVAMSSKDEVGQIAQSIDDAVARTRRVMQAIGTKSEVLAAAAEELSVTAHSVAANVQTVASASEEMGVSIREIAQSTQTAVSVSNQAATLAAGATDLVNELGTSSQEIGSVVSSITSIAEQTNLLALNATIEAARAGAAGRGFAVVASEVKELAGQTATATGEIGGVVSSIQGSTSRAVEAISQITSIVGTINETQHTIASAIEEQSATSSEIATNVVTAASSVDQMAAAITGPGGVAQLAQELDDLTKQFTF